MSRLVLSFLGSPAITYDEKPVTVDTRKAIALMAYIAVTGQSQRRETLAALLWPDYDQPHAYATLRRTLWTLNKAFHGEGLIINRESVALDSKQSLWIDVELFQQSLTRCYTHGHTPDQLCTSCLPLLRRACTLYRADFLAGFNVADSTNFDDWQTFQRDSFRHSYAYVLERLAYGHSALADFEQAIAYARQWLALDQLQENAHFGLMQFYAWAGQRNAALLQYEECVRLLRRELDVAPLENTTQLFYMLKENQIPPPPSFSHTPIIPIQPIITQAIQIAPPRQNTEIIAHPQTQRSEVITPPSLQQPYPLLGRASEWQLMQAAYDSATPHGVVIVLDGEAGIGKTRLVQELLNYGERQGATALKVSCHEEEGELAYGLITNMLHSSLNEQIRHYGQIPQISQHWLQEVARLIPEFIPIHHPQQQQDSPGSEHHFFEGLRQMLLALCQPLQGQARGIMVFEDLQWADAASISFLSFLLRRLQEQRICIVLTLRGAHTEATQRLASPIHALQQRGRVLNLSLARLQLHDIEYFAAVHNAQEETTAVDKRSSVSAAGKVAVTETALALRLFRESEGVPLLLLSYMNELTNGKIRVEDEYWPLPEHVRQVYRTLLTTLSDGARQLLDIAAVIGDTFDFTMLCTLVQQREEVTIGQLEQLLRQGLLIEQETAETKQNPGQDDSSETNLNYAFRSRQIHRYIYTEVSQPRRRYLHRKLAKLLHGLAYTHSIDKERIKFHLQRASSHNRA